MAETITIRQRDPQYRGLRMTAAQYLALEPDGFLYELVDGVVVISPSPAYRHQRVATEIAIQLGHFLSDHPIGEVAMEVDVTLSEDLVYRPDLIYLSRDKAAKCTEHDRVTEIPDVVIEVISADSRSYDTRTKKEDYERAGVGEYWIIDPGRQEFTFYGRRADRFVRVQPIEHEYPAEAIPGFRLDLKAIRKLFPLG